MTRKSPHPSLTAYGTQLEAAIANDVRLKDATKRLYAVAIRLFLLDAGTKPSGWTYAVVEDWRNRLLNDGWPAATVSLYLKGLKAASRRWARRDKEREDFAKDVDLPQVEYDPRTRRVALTREDGEKLLKACKGNEWEDVRDRAMIGLGLYTGMRRAGLCGILGRDVDRNRVTIRLKGGKLHVVVMGKVASGLLKAWLDLSNPHDDEHVFAVTPRQFYGIVKRRAKQAKLKRHVHPHILRHTFISWAVQAGVPTYRIKKMTGQKSDTIIDLYTTDLEAETNPVSDIVANGPEETE